MYRLSAITTQPNVIALFADGSQSFPIQDGTTLVELAEYLDDIGAHHSGPPIGLRVQFGRPHGFPARALARHQEPGCADDRFSS